MRDFIETSFDRKTFKASLDVDPDTSLIHKNAKKSKLTFWLGKPLTVVILAGIVAVYVIIHYWKRDIYAV